MGEVPDSDEEDFETQESLEQQDHDVFTDSLPSNLSKDARNDVWAVPDSSQEIVGQLDKPKAKNGTSSSQILSTATSTGAKRPENEPSEEFVNHGSNETKHSPIGTGSPFHTIDTPASLHQSPVPSLKSHSEQPTTNHRFTGQNRINIPTVTVSQDPEILSDNEQTSPTTSLRLSRSLRPRKPIQQHPYLVESAQYNKFMKSHGMKPLRVRDDPMSTSGQREIGESQDQDFTAEDSQISSGNGGVDTSEGSQPLIFDDPLRDIDELALSPSLGNSSPRRRLMMSSQPSNDDQTDRTSVAGDEDFPSLEELGTWKATGSARIQKRQASPKILSTRKRRRAGDASPLKSASAVPLGDRDVWDMSPSPPVFRLPRGTIELPQNTLRMSAAEASGSPAKASSERDTLSRSVSSRQAPEVMLLGSDESSHSSGASDSESEAVRYMVRKIRGVLPASWLRLDQKTGRDKAVRPVQGRHHDQSPDRAARRGVAQPRQRSSPREKSASSMPLGGFLFDDDDDDDDENNEVENITTSRPTDHVSDLELVDTRNDDDKQGEAEEEDFVDMMLPSQKRRSETLTGYRKSKRRKSQQHLSREHSVRNHRQQKMSFILSVQDSSATESPAMTGIRTKRKRTGVHISSKSILHTRPTRAATPPRLSILDVAESNAPRFIKIAARTARRRPALGKSSPSRKHINLGNRTDNIDALSVLQDWKAGKIKPSSARPGNSHVRSTTLREPLRQLHLNGTASQFTRQKQPHPRRSTSPKQVSLNNFVTCNDIAASQTTPQTSSNQRRLKIVSRARKRNPGPRPAQLETVEENRSGKPGFTARKRHLDALYRRSHARSDPSIIKQPEQQAQHEPQASVRNLQHLSNNEESSSLRSNSPQQKTRFRKQFIPRRRNLDAPQYVHANDPVDSSGCMPVTEIIHENEEKLVGLNPFGIHYTHHFDIFPLDPGVFFHETTLIGQGIFEQVVSIDDFINRLSNERESLSTDFGGRIIQWGPWNEAASSEIGILFDLVAERFTSEQQAPLQWQDWDEARAADFILRYTLQSVNFTEEMGIDSFLNRLSELFSCLLDTLETAHFRHMVENTQESNGRAQILSSLLIVALLLLRVCQSSASYYAASLQSEQILLRLARLTIRDLLQEGFDNVEKTYEDMQRLAARQRGIRRGDVMIHSWVVVIKCLENAQIPRSGFWDVLYATMGMAQVNTCSDAQHLETLWRKIFVLLPLGEFDNAGVLIPGLRHSVPFQGWALPQQLVKRVFQLYRANPRQSPSFNEYCRALVSRCYYLIQQWGWLKCSGIIGAIFDFFGSQNLEHLRNEEVYKSPQFLEDLACKPSLSISPEDRCFHIFLKMLALVIQYLSRHGLINDVKNLVARTLPNHNRQYSKEQTIHQHELAALRNHHDLLCTLFWSAPPDLRPPPQLIEKLVAPGSSHKEACLINLRAWNQLARFVVSSDEETSSYRPFASWQSNVFQQILEQYLSAEGDIQQQYLALSEDVSRDIGQHVLKSMVSQNRAAAMEILHFSVMAFLDVLRHSPSLATAVYCFNSIPLEKIFTKLDLNRDESCWSVVGAGLDIVDHFMSLLEKTLDEQYSFESNSFGDAAQTEEALLLLDQRVASSLVSITRTVMASPQDSTIFNNRGRNALQEKAVLLCGRMASRFIHAGIARLSNYFKPGKHALFDGLPHELTVPQKKHLPLFIATLVQNNIFDFRDIGVTIFELWITLIVVPLPDSAYDDRLAEALRRHDFPYIEKSIVPSRNNPRYSLNRDYFACCIRHMRNSLRHADSIHRRNLRTEFAAMLRLVMQQMRDHLKSLEMDSAEHHLYIGFVREIIALVKSYGADICAVDDYYYQPSREYTPSMEDPQLHTAGIIAYGIRLGEGETTASPQLFYYLLNNFKTAMVNNRLNEERKMLEKGMQNSDVLIFMVNRMLPAIIQATAGAHGAWPLLHVYCGALKDVFTRSCIPREIPDDNAEDVTDLLKVILLWIEKVRENGNVSGPLDPVQLYSFIQLMSICNILAPSLVCWSCQLSTALASKLHALIAQINLIAANAVSYLGRSLNSTDTDGSTTAVYARDLLEGVDLERFTIQTPPQVQTFAQHITADVLKNWISSSNTVTINVPLKAQGSSGTQSGQGTTHDLYTRTGLANELYLEFRIWSMKMAFNQGRIGRQRSRKVFQGSMV